MAKNLTSLNQTSAGNLVVRSGKTLTGAITAVPLATDGLGALGVARFTFDPSAYTAQRPIAAYPLVTLPANAVVLGGFYEVNTAFTSAGGNAGTVALSVVGANDLVTATAVSNAIYGTTGIKSVAPVIETEAGYLKCATAKAITATVAGQALTAGKLTGFIFYTISAATA